MQELEEKQNKTSGLLQIAGVLGVGIGVIALALSIIAMVKVGDISTNTNQKIEKAAALAIDIKKLSDRIDATVIELSDIKSSENSKINTLENQTRNAISSLANNLKSLRDQIEQNRNAIEELSKRSIAKATPAPEVETSTEISQGTKAPELKENSEGQKLYTVKQGDTLGAIAKAHKVSLNALLKANPSVNPSRMSIGQEIVIP